MNMGKAAIMTGNVNMIEPFLRNIMSGGEWVNV